MRDSGVGGDWCGGGDAGGVNRPLLYMAKMKTETKVNSCEWDPMGMVPKNRKKMWPFLSSGRTVLTVGAGAGAGTWGRQDVDDEGVVAKRGSSGREVVKEFDEGDDEREVRRRKRRDRGVVVVEGCGREERVLRKRSGEGVR
jgi:hypothetical protein